MVSLNPQTKQAAPCERCEWRWPGFHICIDKSDPKTKQVVLSRSQKATNNVNRYSGSGYASPDDRERSEARSAAASIRWEAQRLLDAHRDAKIVRLYKDEGYSTRDLAEQFNLNRTTISHILRRAQEKGLVEIRPSGFNR